MQMSELRIAIDMNDAWTALENGSQMVTGVLVARKEFAENHAAEIDTFLQEYQASTEWVNENVADAAQLVEKVGIVKAPVAEKAIPHCNITFLSGEEMKTAMEGYLNVLLEQNPKAIGGSLPAEDFYYAH